ncbi:response regulator transcription factor [Paenibacillus spongiae]|uniref:Response regulator transcription factor n=1 Tax=Paenibacillus spongiae TaxID=2909671 RepID=A0ABY5SF19_9BACL|nr:response regulator transcription factor [Paenibacillus spongiae]UVI31362.1 response regulator transcription factor [Paenibacillus spongiae]
MYNVFIVDDEPFIIEGLYDILDWADIGLTITGHAENGRAAVEALQAVPVDILITDISMPVMNGIELIREARKFLPELKVIILSGYNDFKYVKEGITLGVENYLLKPIDIDELRETLKGTVRKMNSLQMQRALAEFDNRIIRDNVLYRWLTWQISPGIMIERAELLNIDLSKPYMMAVLVRTDPEAADAAEAVERFFSDMPEVIPLHNVEGELILVCTMNDPEQEKPILEEKLLRARSALQTPSAVRISIGSIEPLETAAISYTNAKRAQEYFFLFPEKELMDYGHLPSGRGEAISRLMIDWPEYAKWIVTKDKEQLFTRIDEDYARFRSMNAVSPSEVREITLELIVRFKMELEEIRHTDQSDMFKAGYERVMNANTIDELAAAVKEMADMTIDALVRDVKSPVIQQVLHHIHAHYAESLSLKALGLEYNIHPVYLGQLFNKETNETFTEYINKYRIEKAKELLKDSRLKVHEISRQVGYWESGYFNKQFKKYVGVSPTDYKGLL